jgi:hypothetical protein
MCVHISTFLPSFSPSSLRTVIHRKEVGTERYETEAETGREEERSAVEDRQTERKRSREKGRETRQYHQRKNTKTLGGYVIREQQVKV